MKKLSLTIERIISIRFYLLRSSVHFVVHVAPFVNGILIRERKGDRARGREKEGEK